MNSAPGILVSGRLTGTGQRYLCGKCLCVGKGLSLLSHSIAGSLYFSLGGGISLLIRGGGVRWGVP